MSDAKVGARELRRKLAFFLERARRGEHIVVTLWGSQNTRAALVPFCEAQALEDTVGLSVPTSSEKEAWV